MKYIKEKTDFSITNAAVALGKFDGFHLGHKLIIDKILSLKNEGYNSCIFTFDLSPFKVLGNGDNESIFTNKERAEVANELGIDYLIEYPFTNDFANLLPEEFVKVILIDKLDAKYVVVGTDFRFGKGRLGDTELLLKVGEEYGFSVVVVDKLVSNNQVISSSLIRAQIRNGQIKEATTYLGRNFSINGLVVKGKQIGRTIGFPTVNISLEDGKVSPRNGVYKTKVLIDNIIYKGITNVGSKPTVKDTAEVNVETYIFDFDQFIYGKNIKIIFEDYIREEKKFSSIEELKEQLRIDMKAAM